MSTKYYFDYILDNGDYTIDKSFVDNMGVTKMPGWKYIKTNNNFDIYLDENYIPMGYCFDSYITEEEFERIREKDRPQALVNAMVLSHEQMKKYSSITGYTDEKYARPSPATPTKSTPRCTAKIPTGSKALWIITASVLLSLSRLAISLRRIAVRRLSTPRKVLRRSTRTRAAKS